MIRDWTSNSLDMEHARLLEEVIGIAREAGRSLLDVYATDFDVRAKPDSSPVTLADEIAETSILEALAALTPDIPAISEEAATAGAIPECGDRFWLVDPLDGTREFVNRSDEFTVNIALVEAGKPTLGVVFAPALDRLYGAGPGTPAFLQQGGTRRRISCRRPPAEGLTVISSRSHGSPDAQQAFLAAHRVQLSVHAGSALKFCILATGEADMYPRLGRTMEWDTAAGHALLCAAGGRIAGLDGKELAYGKPGFANPHFVATGLQPTA